MSEEKPRQPDGKEAAPPTHYLGKISMSLAAKPAPPKKEK